MDIVERVLLIAPVIFDVIEKEAEIGWDVDRLSRGQINADDFRRWVFIRCLVKSMSEKVLMLFINQGEKRTHQSRSPRCL